MKKGVLIVLLMSCSILAHAKTSTKMTTDISVGVQQHVDHSSFKELPFGNGDLSYAIAYELREGPSYWQLVLDVAPDITGADSVDYMLTPQLNIIFEDNIWQGGLGILNSYVERDSDSGWTGLYWQFLFGIHGSSGKIRLDLSAYYAFDNWSALDDFDTGDIGYGLWLRWPF